MCKFYKAEGSCQHPGEIRTCLKRLPKTPEVIKTEKQQDLQQAETILAKMRWGKRAETRPF